MPSPILSIINTIIIGTMLNNNSGYNGHLTIKQTFSMILPNMLSVLYRFHQAEIWPRVKKKDKVMHANAMLPGIHELLTLS